MNKTILGLMVVPLVLSGCIKKAEEKPTEKTEKTSTIKATEQPPKEENIIPAMLVRNFLVKFQQPKICAPNPDVDGIVIYAELSGDFPLGDSRQPIYKSLRPFDLVS